MAFLNHVPFGYIKPVGYTFQLWMGQFHHIEKYPVHYDTLLF